VRLARENGQTMTVFSATVLEAAYVLASRAAGYGWDRAAIAAAVSAVTEEPAFDVEHATALRLAAATHRERSIDLHDCFVAALAGDRATRVLSFEDDFRPWAYASSPDAARPAGGVKNQVVVQLSTTVPDCCRTHRPIPAIVGPTSPRIHREAPRTARISPQNRPRTVRRG
jgi:predicted nucleic-acid-binding protein